MTNKMYKVKLLKKEATFSTNQLLIFVLIFGLIGGYLLIRSFAVSTVVATVEGENMVAPVTSGTTMGETKILSTADSGNGNLLVAQSAKLGQTQTLQSLSFYVTTAAGKLRLGLYSTGSNGGPGTKLAETAEITPTTGWNTANVITPVSLNAGTYWLAYLPSDNNLHFVKTQDTTSSGKYYGYAYGTMPASFSSTPNSTASHWSFYGTLNTPSVSMLNSVGAATGSHSVDGNLSEADWNVATPIAKCVIGTCNNTGTYGALWDNQYLYIGAKVLDSTLKKDSTNMWDDDSVEAYVDADANGGTTYDSNDKQFTQGWNNSALGGISASTPGVLHAWSSITGGYSVEFAIPWSSLGVSPAAGKTVGLDVGYNDDDNGGARDNQGMTYGTSQNFNNPSGFGHIGLAAPVSGSTTQVITDTAASNGKALKLLSNTTVSSQFSATATVASISVNAKADVCSGTGAAMVVKVDGTQVLSNTVNATSWTGYSAALNLAVGTHTLAISYTNDGAVSGCDNNLYIDKTDFISPDTTPPSVPTVTLSASPTSIAAGSSSTLTWNSTNATYCTASGAWSGQKAVSGSASTGALNATATYSLNCTGSGGTSPTASATVTVTAPPPPPSGGLGIPKFGQTIDGNDPFASVDRQNFQAAAYHDLHAGIVRTQSCSGTTITYLQKFTSEGIRPLCLMASTASWNYPTSHPTSDMANLCTAAAKNFGAKNAIMEPINEPDLHGWLGHFDVLAQYQKACWDAVKAVNPSLKVVSSGFWDGNKSDSTWINNMAQYFNAGGGSYEDGLNIHCYGDPTLHGPWSIWDQTFGSGGAGYYDGTNVRSLMAAHGLSGQPIICTEGGETLQKTTQDGQATIYQRSMNTVDGIGTGYRKLASWFAFTLFDDSLSCCSGKPYSFGELNPPTSTSPYSATPRPSYNTFKNMAIQAGQ